MNYVVSPSKWYDDFDDVSISIEGKLDILLLFFSKR